MLVLVYPSQWLLTNNVNVGSCLYFPVPKHCKPTMSMSADVYLSLLQVKDVMKDLMDDLRQTNLERTLLVWCRHSTQG